MKVRNASTARMASEHEDQAKVWHLLEEGECRTLDHVEEFTVKNEVQPHRSRILAEEFYYVLQGRGIMNVDNEEKEVVAGDLVYIPPGALHGIRVAKRPPLRVLSWKSAL